MLSWRLVFVLAGVLLLAGLGFRLTKGVVDPTQKGSVLVPDAPQAVGLTPTTHGGLVYGELRTGKVKKVAALGRSTPKTVAKLRVSAQKFGTGLVGLTVGRNGKIYAAWIWRRHLYVGHIRSHRSPNVIWRSGHLGSLGPYGGSLGTAPDGSLLLSLASQTRRPQGKIMSLSSGGKHRGRIISSGWLNPYAFTVTRKGQMWVADNSFSKRSPERLLPVSRLKSKKSGGALPDTVAPSGLVALNERRFAICGYRSKELTQYRVSQKGAVENLGSPLAEDCQLGVAKLDDGRLVYSTGRDIRTVWP